MDKIVRGYIPGSDDTGQANALGFVVYPHLPIAFDDQIAIGQDLDEVRRDAIRQGPAAFHAARAIEFTAIIVLNSEKGVILDLQETVRVRVMFRRDILSHGADQGFEHNAFGIEESRMGVKDSVNLQAYQVLLKLIGW